MIWYALGLTAVGLFLSAFFSGSETGFYRATRLRLVLDALAGDRVAMGLHWLANHPSLFVATTLVGNNLANYVTSLAIVLGAAALVPLDGHAAELLVPLVLAPLLFVYGELLPKNLFLQSPNRLLRRVGPLLLLFVVLFFPVSVLLWGLNRLLSRFGSESPEEVRLTLARRELRRAMEEGHEVGILRPAQRELAQGIFATAQLPVARFTSPIEQLPRAHTDMSKEEVLRLAGRHRIAVVPVETAGSRGELIGYVRVIELALSNSDEVDPLHQLLEIPHHMPHVAALTRMQSSMQSLARVVNGQGEMVGIVTADQLREPLLRGRKGRLLMVAQRPHDQ